MAEYIHVVSF